MRLALINLHISLCVSLMFPNVSRLCMWHMLQQAWGPTLLQPDLAFFRLLPAS